MPPGHRRVDYVRPGASTYSQVLLRILENDELGGVLEQPWTRYAPRQRERERWYGQPLVPGVLEPDAFGAGLPVSRVGDELQVFLAPFTDTDRHVDLFSAFRPTPEKRLRLHREGRLIADVPQSLAAIPLPPGPGNYRLSLDVDAAAVLPLSRRSSTEWTFRSSGGGGRRQEVVPLVLVDYAFPLDRRNRLTGSRVELRARTQPGAEERRVRSVQFELSTDDGQTWQAVALSAPDRDGRVGGELPELPAGAEVSIRARAELSGGAGVRQTVERAFRVAPR